MHHLGDSPVAIPACQCAVKTKEKVGVMAK